MPEIVELLHGAEAGLGALLRIADEGRIGCQGHLGLALALGVAETDLAASAGGTAVEHEIGIEIPERLGAGGISLGEGSLALALRLQLAAVAGMALLVTGQDVLKVSSRLFHPDRPLAGQFGLDTAACLLEAVRALTQTFRLA
ncbi:hypothetical protein DK412_08930 [Methylobacterium sp. 17Sr1-1]|nr:hypothetical protein DK412_08930 [Methylobacterium sp. 17Sr1-1]